MDGYLSLLTTGNRLLRLLLGHPDGIRDSELLPQRCKGVEAICEGIELRIYCVSLDARIALKTLIGLPAELQIVTDTGKLRRICGIVAEASQGESDGGLASYQLVVRDALAILDLSASTRVFLNQSELDVVRTVLNEIRHAKSAADSLAMPVDDQPQAALHTALKQWENGSNTCPKGNDGGAALIGITAPEGISFATSKSVVSYASLNTDIVTGQHLQLSAAQRFNLNTGQGVSLFAQNEGITAIAQQGKVLVQSQHGEMSLTASGELQLTASDGRLVGTAQEIVLISKGGSFIKISDSITIGTTGKMVFNAAGFDFRGPKSIAVAMPAFRDADPVERLVLRDAPEYAIDSSFALDQLQAFAKACEKGEFIASVLPIFGYDIPAPTYLRLYDALRDESFPNARILLTKDGRHPASFDNETMEIRILSSPACSAHRM
jgi:uncharacterized protein (DUF2345 family)